MQYYSLSSISATLYCMIEKTNLSSNLIFFPDFKNGQHFCPATQNTKKALILCNITSSSSHSTTLPSMSQLNDSLRLQLYNTSLPQHNKCPQKLLSAIGRLICSSSLSFSVSPINTNTQTLLPVSLSLLATQTYNTNSSPSISHQHKL